MIGAEDTVNAGDGEAGFAPVGTLPRREFSKRDGLTRVGLGIIGEGLETVGEDVLRVTTGRVGEDNFSTGEGEGLEAIWETVRLLFFKIKTEDAAIITMINIAGKAN